MVKLIATCITLVMLAGLASPTPDDTQVDTQKSLLGKSATLDNKLQKISIRRGRKLTNIFPFVAGNPNAPRASFFPPNQQLRDNNRRISEPFEIFEDPNNVIPERRNSNPRPRVINSLIPEDFDVEPESNDATIVTQEDYDGPVETIATQSTIDVYDAPLENQDPIVTQSAENEYDAPLDDVPIVPEIRLSNFDQLDIFSRAEDAVDFEEPKSTDVSFRHPPVATESQEPIEQVESDEPVKPDEPIKTVGLVEPSPTIGIVVATAAPDIVPHSEQEPDPRLPRQGADVAKKSDEGVLFDIGSIASAGEKCVDKVVVVEETEFDDVIECRHSYSKQCHATFKTDFEPQQEEECDENFVKKCFIEYKKVSQEETIKFCHTPLVCNGEGPKECKTVFETECQTKYHEHKVEDDVADCSTIQEEKCETVSQGYTSELKCTKWPKQVCSQSKQLVSKYSPVTDCRKVPREVCGPSGCNLQPGPEECFDKKEFVVQEVPEETCNLEPQRSCKQATRLVPLLKAGEDCTDVPKEVCSRIRVNPRKVQKPLVKKWCYVPSQQSGLA